MFEGKTILITGGTGTFGQVFRCVKNDGLAVAVKVIKNKPAYHTQGKVEIDIIRTLNRKYGDVEQIVRMERSFLHEQHICIVFELLGVSVLDLIMENKYRGLSLNLVQNFTKQLVRALVTLEDANIIHCDLKPAKRDWCLNEVRQLVVYAINAADRIQVKLGPCSCLVPQHGVSQQTVGSRCSVLAKQHGHAAFARSKARRCLLERGKDARTAFAGFARQGRDVDEGGGSEHGEGDRAGGEAEDV